MEAPEGSTVQSVLTDSLEKRIQHIVRLYKDFADQCDAEVDQIDRTHLRKKIENLKQGRFLLVVAGEVSSGKSTFINALLGEELLPTGVEQTTSAIINLRYGEEKTLCVEFANQVKEHCKAHNTEDWEGTVSKRLRELGAVPDTFDDVPVTLLQAFRVQHGDNWKKALSKLTRELAPELKHNPRKYDTAKLEARCREYLDEHGQLRDIPTSIEITYPFPHASHRLHIVDSPGVHAVGSVENVTHDYLNDAHAILFLRSVSDPAESTSFFEFVDDNVVDRSHEALFLVLTKASKEGRRAIRKKSAQYEELFAGRNIGADHILVVDSLLRLVAGDVASAADALELREEYEKWLDHYDALAEGGDSVAENHAIELGEKLDLLERYVPGSTDSQLLQDKLNSEAGFGAVEKRLSRLAERSVDLQAEEILCKLRKGLGNAIGDLEENIELDEADLKGKDTLEREIKERKDELQQLESAFSTKRDELSETHTQDSSKKRKEVRKKIKRVQDKLDNHSNETRLKTVCLRISEEGKKLTQAWMKELVVSCDDVLREHEESVEGRTVSVPKIDPDESLIDDLRKEYTSTEVKMDGGTFNKKIRTEESFNSAGFIRQLRKHLKAEVVNHGSKLWNRYTATANKVLEDYSSKLMNIIDSKREAYEHRLSEKMEMDELRDRLEQHRNRLDELNALREDATSCLVTIKPNAPCLTNS